MRVDVTVEQTDGEQCDMALVADASASTRAVIDLLRNSSGFATTTEPIVDGSPLDDSRSWRDQIRNGSVVSSTSRKPMPCATARLVVSAGPDAGTVHELSQRTTTVGRDPECDIVLDDPAASRLHALFVTEGTRVYVEDCSSTNGIRLDGRPITARTAIAANNLVRLGNTVLRLDTGVLASSATAEDESITWPSPPQQASPARLPIASCVASIGGAAAIGLVMHSMQFLVIGITAPAVLVLASATHWARGRRAARRAQCDYATAVEQAEQRISAAIDAETLRRRHALPDAIDLAQRIADETRPRSASQALRVRIGVADQPSDVLVVHADTATSAGMIPLVPVEVCLDPNVTYIVGDTARCRSLARWIALQLCAALSSEDLELVLVTDCDREDDWAWARWLPQLFNGCPARSAPPLTARERGKRLVVVDASSTDDVVSDVLLRSSPDAVVVIAQGAPTGCASLTVTADGVVTLRTPSTYARAVADGLPTELAERVARRLSSAFAPADGNRPLPDGGTLLDLLGDDTLADLSRRWNCADGGARTTIGTRRAAPYEIDLCTEGPHTLIVGTTGSGKSELLQTLVAGLALNHPPDELSFALIDYKGGATFAAFADLPHTSSLLTDLDEAAAARALVSLQAELRRRESLFATAGASSFDDYRTSGSLPRLPRLVIVIDELAAFLEQQAELGGNLRDIALRGRSLGLHLVLATQRGGNTVPSDIRSNTNIRVALRMTDTADSREVVGTDEAAEIGVDAPGAAVVRGAEGAHRIQVARVSVASAVSANAQLVPLGPWRSIASTSPEHEVSDLRRIVSATRATAAAQGRARQPAPWLPALPTMLTTEHIADIAVRLVVPFGLADKPEEQRQDPLRIDLRGGTAVAFAGGPRSGRSTALTTIAQSASDRLAPSELVLHVIDAGGGDLVAATARLPHVGTVTTCDDPAVVARLVERLVAEVKTRQRLAHAQTTANPSVAMLLVDGLENVVRRMDGYDNGLTSTALIELVSRGPSVGISAVLAGDASSGGAAGRVTETYALGNRASNVAARGALRTDGTPWPPGRGVRESDRATIQVALYKTGASSQRWSTATPVANRIVVRALPTSITLSELTVPDGHFVFGVGGDDAHAIAVDLVASAARVVVSGPPSAGKSTALISLLDQAVSAGVRVCVAADRYSPLGAAAASFGLSTVRPGESRPPIDCYEGLLLIDDVDRFVDTDAEDALTTVIAGTKRRCAVVASGDATSLSIRHRGAVAELRRFRCGLLLQPRPVDGDLVGVRLRNVSPSVVPGRGVLVPDPRWSLTPGPRAPIPIQVAVPASYTYPMCG